MRLRTSALAVTMLAGLAPSVTHAQVTARQGTPQDVAIESPMVVEVVIPAWKAPARDKPTSWTTRETAKFVCDKARVNQLQVTRSPRPRTRPVGPGSYPWPKSAHMALELTPTLSTEWYRQDVDVTITLFEADGKTVLGTKKWDNLTIGAENAASAIGAWGSSSSKRPTLIVGLSESEVARFESEGMRAEVVVEIQD